MKRQILLLLVLITLGAKAQDLHPYPKFIDPQDSIFLINLPELELPAAYKGPDAKVLPNELDNSQYPYFRPIFNQYNWSCGQASTIGYNLTYEINRRDNTSADLPEHQFPPQFAYNFYNSAENGVGVCYFYTDNLISRCGTPTVADYGGMGNEVAKWISGYNIYYNGMVNRIDKVYTIHVGDEQGLQTLKYWIYDHLDGSPTGGVANFYTDLYNFTHLAPGTPEEGAAVITAFGPYSGHSMTFLGWNDSIRYDYNEDGQYTNDIDINGDGVVNMKDWEIGGVRLANSWGDGWADGGFCWVMYNVLAREKADGGLWNKQVNVFTIKQDYHPIITYKITLTHDSRNKIQVTAGISTDTSDMWPEYTMDFPIFNYQGGDHYMQGDDSQEQYKTIEFGLDVMPLLSYIQNGQPARFFLQVHEKDPMNMATGAVDNFSFMDYSNGLSEIPCGESNVDIVNNGITTLSVVHALTWDKVSVNTESLPPFTAGESYTAQLSATGGTQPYTWEMVPGYLQNQDEGIYPQINGEQLSPSNNQSGMVTKTIDFDFPFYDQSYTDITIHTDGFLMFREMPYPLPYQVEDMLLFRNEPMIAPFLNKEITLNPSSGDGIWYEGDETHASFRWKATIETPDGDEPLDFTATLYPDGNISLYCDSYNSPDEINRVTGISKGNGSTYQTASMSNTMPYESGQVVTYTPQSFPVDANVSEEGVLSVMPEDAQKIYNIAVKVIDDEEISDTRILQLSDGLTYSYSIVSGNNDRIDCGETAHLSFSLNNTGSETINNATLTALINSSYVNINDNFETVGNIAPGATVELTDAISFTVENIIPDDFTFLCNISIDADEQSWSSRINLKAYSPSISIGTPIILDNEDGRLDPGETADIVLPLFNTGHSLAEDVQAQLSTFDPFITINSSTQLNYGNIQTGEVSYDTVNVSANANTPQGHTINFGLEITAQPDISLIRNFQIRIGRFPVYIVDLDPESLSTPGVEDLLDEMDIQFESDNFIPNNLDNYQNVFVFLGRKFSQHILTEFEGNELADFLQGGGNLYLEGGLTWTDDPQTAVQPLFHMDTTFLGWNEVDSVFGVAGSFTGPMKFVYSSPMMYYNYNLVPQDTAFAILQDETGTHNFAIAHESENYKTIGSMIDFGGLMDNTYPSIKKNLLAKILNFFGMDIIVTDTKENKYLTSDLLFNCTPNPASGQTTVNFRLNKDNEIALVIFDLSGKKMIQTASGKVLSAGHHKISIDVSYLNSGVYICRLTTGNQNNYIKLVVSK